MQLLNIYSTINEKDKKDNAYVILIFKIDIVNDIHVV